jgi:hypothetical protein
MVVPSVAEALAELRSQFGDANLSFVEDGSGGAFVMIENVQVLAPYNSPTWLGFHIAYTYPDATIYPMYARGDLRDDFNNPALQRLSYRNREATQISRRSPQGASETAVLKVLKTLAWLESLE